MKFAIDFVLATTEYCASCGAWPTRLLAAWVSRFALQGFVRPRDQFIYRV